jgi:periplasmic divalent cation tolerance protein
MKIKLIFTTTDSKDNAENITKVLINNNLSPCVQIFSNISSFYKWNDEIKNTREFIILIKTLEENLDSCIEIIKKEHNYEIPEIIEVDSNILENNYSKWFNENIN